MLNHRRYEHFVDLYHELSEVSFNEGNKNLKFGVLDCSTDSQLCDELQVKRNLELQYYGDSNQWKTLNDFLAKTINDVLKEDVTIAKFDQPGSMCVLFKIVSCPYCQEALQQWTRVESYYENSTRIHAATFDCTRHRSYCHRFNVRRYPAILYIENTSDGLQQFDKFNEDRTSMNIIHYCDRMYRTKRDSSL